MSLGMMPGMPAAFGPQAQSFTTFTPSLAASFDSRDMAAIRAVAANAPLTLPPLPSHQLFQGAASIGGTPVGPRPFTIRPYPVYHSQYYQATPAWPPAPPEPLLPLKSNTPNMPHPPAPLPGAAYPFAGGPQVVPFYGSNYFGDVRAGAYAPR